MVRKTFSIPIFIFFMVLAGSGVTHSQSLTIELDVNPVVGTSLDQKLDFGSYPPGSGLHRIQLGSPSMGVYQVRALRSQNLIVIIDPVDELVHEELGRMASIPLNLQVSYTKNGSDDYRSSTSFTGNREFITLEPSGENPQSSWSGLFLYVYGNIDLGTVPAGAYTGTVLLTIVYV